MRCRPTILTTEDQAAAVLRGRRETLGMSQDELTDRIGMADGYAAKLEAPARAYGRKAVQETFFWWAKALGLAVVIMDRAQAEALVASSTDAALVESEHRPYPGRDAKRPAVRRTRVRIGLAFTA